MLDDQCAKCHDVIEYVGYRDQWYSITRDAQCEVCLLDGRAHEPAYAVG